MPKDVRKIAGGIANDSMTVAHIEQQLEAQKALTTAHVEGQLKQPAPTQTQGNTGSTQPVSGPVSPQTDTQK